MSKAHRPELKKYMDKKVLMKINNNRIVTGFLRGFDPFLNIVLDEASERTKEGQEIDIGMVVVRGNSVDVIESLERI